MIDHETAVKKKISIGVISLFSEKADFMFKNICKQPHAFRKTSHAKQGDISCFYHNKT